MWYFLGTAVFSLHEGNGTVRKDHKFFFVTDGNEIIRKKMAVLRPMQSRYVK
jgi:hypothetical protein